MCPTTDQALYECVAKPVRPKTRIAAFKWGFYCSTRGYAFKHFEPTALMEGTFKGQKLFQPVPKIERFARQALRL
jgi:hypothetical protein